MVLVRNDTGRPHVRFDVGVHTDLRVAPDGGASEYRAGSGWHHHHTGGELGHGLEAGSGFSPVFVFPGDGLTIEAELVPGKETLLRSCDANWRGRWRHSLYAKEMQARELNRAHRITRRDDHGAVWGILDEYDLLYTVRECR